MDYKKIAVFKKQLLKKYTQLHFKINILKSQ